MLSFGRRIFSRGMSTTHLERTKDVARKSKVLTNAVVSKIEDISPTVKFLKMHIKEEGLSFQPGQWVDFYIPELSVVGGYSMCSSPSLLEKSNELHLAVKYSDHKPAHWIHTQCKDNAEVHLKVGGNIVYDAREEKQRVQNVLLVAGGVGINPLYSMFLNNVETYGGMDNKETGKTVLLYSGTEKKELIFKEEIDKIVSRDSSFQASYFVTKEKGSEVDMNYRRIEEDDLRKVLEGVAVEDHKCFVTYLCGPSPMMADIKKKLVKLGVAEHQIKYESWW